MSDKLDLILSALQGVQSEGQKLNQRIDVLNQRIDVLNQRIDVLEEGQKETNQIVRALRDGQEEMKAQMEGLALDVHKLHGEVTAIRQERQRDRDISDIRAGRTQREILEINSRLEQLEREKN
jgi:chromosome segregation ATPase